MCNFSDMFIYVSGGMNSRGKIVDTVVRYNINQEKWEDVAKLNMKRWNHSSCALNEAIYVVSGKIDMGH